MKRWLAAIALTALSAGSVQAAPSGPAARNVTLSDLPTGFTIVSDVNDTMAQWAKKDAVTVATVTQWGWIADNELEFQRNAQLGIVQIDADIEQFHTATQAHAEFQRSLKDAAKQKSMQQMSLAAVGIRRAAWKETYHQGQLAAEWDFALFERGTYVAGVIISGRPGTMDVGELDVLTRIIDRRIQARG